MYYNTPEMVSSHTARKPRRCTAGDTIAAGERYTRRATPPWVMIADDPDSVSPLGHWEVFDWHPACHDRHNFIDSAGSGFWPWS
jgi:hypothetical protein